jgi:hypothetical protein
LLKKAVSRPAVLNKTLQDMRGFSLYKSLHPAPPRSIYF